MRRIADFLFAVLPCLPAMEQDVHPSRPVTLISPYPPGASDFLAPKRMASVPDVPTATEVGMPSLDMSTWFGLYAPLGTPKPIIETLNKALRDIVTDKGVAQQLEKIETELFPVEQATPAALRTKLSSQIELRRPIIEKAGVQAE